MSDKITSIAPEQFPESPILEACKTPEVSAIILASIDERITRLRSQEPIDPMSDTSFELQDLATLREALQPESDDEKSYLTYRYIRNRDGSIVTSIVHKDDLNEEGKVSVSTADTSFNPIHTLEIIESSPEERRTRNPADKVVREPKKRISFCDVHLYRAPNGQVLRRASAGLALSIFADGSVEAVQTFVGADGRQYEDPLSLRATESNHPAARILQ